MTFEHANPLAQERRARLAAERRLKQRSVQLDRDHAKMEQQTRALTQTVMAKRAELDDVRRQAEDLQAKIDLAQNELSQARLAAAESEERLWQALQTVRDGFALFDADHRLVMANKAYLAIFDGLECVAPGASYADMCELMISEGIVDPQGCKDAWLRKMLKRWDSTPVPPVTVCLWNGQFVELVDRPTPDGGMVTLGLNQTQTLRVSAATEMMPDAFVIFDRDDRLVMCNERYREMFPLTAEIIQPGVYFSEMLRLGLEKGQFVAAIGREEDWFEEQINRHRAPHDTITEQQLADGRWIRVLQGPTPDGGRVGLRIDITQHKTQQAELEKARRIAEVSSRAKSNFLANMSHEFRTPMNGIVGMAQMLSGGDLPETERHMAHTIQQSADTLLRVLDDVLDFSQVDADKLVLRNQTFNLDTLIRDIILLQMPLVEAKSLSLSYEGGGILGTPLRGDPARLRQIIMNLVGNAVKFTQTGKVWIDVAARPAQASGHVALDITVRDTGRGVPQDKADFIFGEFNQIEADNDRSHDGSGLGLSIARKMARLMGGDVCLDLSYDEGAAFVFSVQLAAADRQATGVAADPALPQKTARRRLKVLAAEDNRTNQMVLSKMLEGLDLDLTLVNDGQAAVESFAADRPDLVFMDISMPVLDGKQATQRIRQIDMEQKRPPVHVVAMTAHASQRDAQDFLAAGLDQVITKPMQKAELTKIVQTAQAALGDTACRAKAGASGLDSAASNA